jgi:signal transduction histidine kinase
MNLMGNAVKFTQQGEARLRVFLPNNSHWAIEVSDTGPGIPAEEQESIFEPFRRRKDVSAKKESGTGLGLSIVRQLTELMGGAIYLQSKEGKGSTFTIILPLYTEESAVLNE